MKSINRVIQDGIYLLMSSHATALAPDTRDVTVTKDIPDSEFSQKSMPKVAVFTALTNSKERGSSDHVTMVFSVPFLMIDSTGGSFDKEIAAKERLNCMAYNITAICDQMTGMDLNCADLGILADENQWEFNADIDGLGANLLSLLLTLKLTVQVPLSLDLNNLT